MRCSSVCRARVLRVAARSCGIAGTRRSRWPIGRLWRAVDPLVAARCSEYARADAPRISRNARGPYMASQSDHTRYMRQIVVTTDFGAAHPAAREDVHLRVGSNVGTIPVLSVVAPMFRREDTRRAGATSEFQVPWFRCGCPDARCCLPVVGCPTGCRSYRHSHDECGDLQESVRTWPAKRPDVQIRECRQGARCGYIPGCQCDDHHANGDSVHRCAASCIRNTVGQTSTLSVSVRNDHTEIAPTPSQDYTATGLLA